MAEKIDWGKTTFEGSRLELLKKAKTLTIRQRLEAMDELYRLSERIRTICKKSANKDDQN